MRIKRKDEFGDIGTAVFYKYKYFIPDLDYIIDQKYLPDVSPEDILVLSKKVTLGRLVESQEFVESVRRDLVENLFFSANKVLLHGGTKHFDNIDFAEYDFNVVLENHKFNSKDIISYLDKETADLVGTDLGSLGKINSTLFPTLSNGTENDKEYFNTLSMSAVTLYLFNLEPEIYKIELYEDVIDSNDTHNPTSGFIDYDALRIAFGNPSADIPYSLPSNRYIEPAVTIYLGPNQECYENSESMFNSNDPLREGDLRLYQYSSKQEYFELYDEIYSGKAVWLALSTDNTIKEVNLSYYAWLQSEDANIFKRKFNLRNDDYYDKTKSEYLEKTNFDYTDKRSGRLLGTLVTPPAICPILSKKLNKINRRNSLGTVDNIPPYDPEIEYAPGDLVVFNDEFYKSLKKHNRGHFPSISAYWALKDSVDDFSTTRVTIVNYTRVGDNYAPDMSAGISWPNKQITISDNLQQADMRFKVNANLGYEFVDVCVETVDGTMIPLKKKDPEHPENDYGYVWEDVVGEEDYYTLITIISKGWDQILAAESRKRIVFVFKGVYSVINMTYNLDNQVSQPVSIFGRGDSSRPIIDPYSIVLCGLGVEGEGGYLDTNGISERLSKLSSSDIITSLEFALIDYTHDATSKFLEASLLKLSKGEIESSVKLPLKVTTFKKEWETGSGRIDTPMLNVNLGAVDFEEARLEIKAGNKVTAIVSEYYGFEVDNEELLINYKNDPGEDPALIHFYGTYGDNFGRIDFPGFVIINDSTGQVTKLDAPGTYILKETETSDLPIAVVVLSKEGSMYTLSLREVIRDLNIKLIDKNDIE